VRADVRAALNADAGKVELKVTREELASLREAVKAAITTHDAAFNMSRMLDLVGTGGSYQTKVGERVKRFEALSLMLERASR
jgi:hypothetical protein